MMATFEQRYKLLNPEQRQAVDTLEGPVMVIAGPGTGKTEMLTMRIANILRGGGTSGGRAGVHKRVVSPEKILALTFTESGAIAMRRRLVELVGQDAYRVEISHVSRVSRIASSATIRIIFRRSSARRALRRSSR